ncbi:hypothetical protein PILCRDRAFT_816604 [Piloderma croceum F 1598]|uniref:Uncharacterized protein n=1 Tax=Piloderma croceum (strain F 1598) TaxID=765440 RepID=A0A0C3G5X8_PILCF|nr:hypothetical protein PILCRDRAFT_816604 [Piloderma croceum F 1598]
MIVSYYNKLFLLLSLLVGSHSNAILRGIVPWEKLGFSNLHCHRDDAQFGVDFIMF